MGTPTKKLFRDDAYLSVAEARVIGHHGNDGVILDQTNFYPQGGGQPGDTGHIETPDGKLLRIIDTRYADDKHTIIHILDHGADRPTLGETLILHIDWDRRYTLMRLHTACHILSAIIDEPVTGCGISEDSARVDFDLPEVPAKDWINEEIARIVAENHPVVSQTIGLKELETLNLIRSKHMQPGHDGEFVRLVQIGKNGAIDRQPCGGTHISETFEIGSIHVTKIENKGRENRRFRLSFGPATF